MSVDALRMPPEIRLALTRASAATGQSFESLAETARRESGYAAGAKATGSSATGLFQFIESTWLTTVKRYGARHGLAGHAEAIGADGRVGDPARRAEILALRNDPELSARMAAELARENAEGLARSLGRQPAPGEVYAAHVMGLDGARRLIAAAEQSAPNAAALFPAAARANPWIFYEGGAPRSAGEVLARLTGARPGPATAPAAPPASPPVRGFQLGSDAATFVEAFIRETLADLLAPARLYGALDATEARRVDVRL